MQLFGFEVNRKKKEEEEQKIQTFALPQYDDGAVLLNTGAYYGTYVDMDGVVRNEVEQITRYRDMAIQPELEDAINDIVNEAIVTDETGKCVEINLDNLEYSESIKKKITDEFNNILKLLDFSDMGYDIFRSWYIDGRLFYHVMINNEKPQEGIKEIRYIDPRRIRKVREIQKTRDTTTGAEIIKATKEYFLYNDRGILGVQSNLGQRIAVDSIVNVNSGLLDAKRSMVLSYLHKAIKPLNQLRMVEDATVIYRLSRAPERRVFYIDVGNMSTIKADQYLKSIMTKYRNKLVYDARTGEIRDDRKHMAMLEDFWLPRREGGRASEISTLPGGQNLGEIQDVEYFEKKLYKALGVPYSRTQPQTGFSLGRSTEITRDELKFSRQVDRLRGKFSGLFDGLLKTQLILKKICSEEEWEDIKENIYYQFLKDNNFEELKEVELNMNRVGSLTAIEPFIGRFYSAEWVKKNILRQTEDEIEEMKKQMEAEQEEMIKNAPKDEQGNPLPVDPQTGMPLPPQPQPNMEADKPTIQSSQMDPKRKPKFQMSGMDMIAGR